MMVQVIDSLKIASPVLIGHSMAGGEITLVAGQHPDRLLGLVYLEALRDPTRDYSQISKELQAGASAPCDALRAERQIIRRISAMATAEGPVRVS